MMRYIILGVAVFIVILTGVRVGPLPALLGIILLLYLISQGVFSNAKESNTSNQENMFDEGIVENELDRSAKDFPDESSPNYDPELGRYYAERELDDPFDILKSLWHLIWD